MDGKADIEDESVSERVALITGASGGIGQACARALAKRGFRLALQYQSNAKPCEALVEKLKDPRQAEIFQADLGAPGQAEDLIVRIRKKLGPTQVLVHSAGALVEKPIAFTSSKEWDALLELHAVSGFSLAKAMQRDLSKQKWGRLIFIGSMAGQSGLGNGAAYAASKGALTGLTRTLALECGRWNVTSNLIAPGYIETAMTTHHNDARKERIRASVPLGRYGRPEEVAGLAGFLASEEGSYLNGQILLVDGGLSLVS